VSNTKTRGTKLLQIALEDRKISQAQCARLMEIDRSRLNRIYHGRATPVTREAMLLQRLFGIPLAAWFCDERGEMLCV
jgi:transcriptional regulator with XRE-family HTH domain